MTLNWTFIDFLLLFIIVTDEKWFSIEEMFLQLQKVRNWQKIYFKKGSNKFYFSRDNFGHHITKTVFSLKVIKGNRIDFLIIFEIEFDTF